MAEGGRAGSSAMIRKYPTRVNLIWKAIRFNFPPSDICRSRVPLRGRGFFVPPCGRGFAARGFCVHGGNKLPRGAVCLRSCIPVRHHYNGGIRYGGISPSFDYCPFALRHITRSYPFLGLCASSLVLPRMRAPGHIRCAFIYPMYFLSPASAYNRPAGRFLPVERPRIIIGPRAVFSLLCGRGIIISLRAVFSIVVRPRYYNKPADCFLHCCAAAYYNKPAGCFLHCCAAAVL